MTPIAATFILVVGLTGFALTQNVGLLLSVFVSIIFFILFGLQLYQVTSGRPWYTGRLLPEEVITMTPEGIALGIEGVPHPTWVPWGTTPGFRCQGQQGGPALALVQVPGLTPPMPVAPGLFRPLTNSSQSSLGTTREGYGPIYNFRALDQPAEAIDHAMRHLSGGRAAILQ